MSARGALIDVSVQLVTEQCCECGVLFAFPQELKDQLLKRTTSGSFYCPNGHGQHYLGESDDAKIKRLKREVEQARENAEAQAKSAEYAWRQADLALFEQKRLKREARKAERRAAAAVCPVPGCQRTIIQMQRHLATKHKDWVTDHIEVHNQEGAT